MPEQEPTAASGAEAELDAQREFDAASEQRTAPRALQATQLFAIFAKDAQAAAGHASGIWNSPRRRARKLAAERERARAEAATKAREVETEAAGACDAPEDLVRGRGDRAEGGGLADGDGNTRVATNLQQAAREMKWRQLEARLKQQLVRLSEAETRLAALEEWRRPRLLGTRSRRTRLASLIVVALAGGLWLAAHVRERTSSLPAADASAVAVSDQKLQQLAQAVGQPIFWAGALPGMRYELTRVPAGITIRYLPTKSRIARQAPLLVVTTSAVRGAFAATLAAGDLPGAQTLKLRGGAIAISFRRRRQAYIAYPGWPFQVKLVASSPALARQLVASGRLQPVPGTARPPGPTVAALSLAQLRRLAASLGRPLYWAGPQSAVTYELTREPDGRIYLRYLPPGVPIRSPQPVLTISTLPLRHAFAVTQAVGKHKRAGAIKVPGGGIAIVQKGVLYLAYPGSDYQAGVFDPVPGAARRLVAAGRIVAIRSQARPTLARKSSLSLARPGVS